MYMNAKFEPEKETRYVSIMTYATREEINSVIEAKRSYIDAVAYITHDKDENEPHTHIAMILKRSRKQGVVRNWFKKCVDQKSQIANTMLEPLISAKGLEEYFTHSDDDSKQKGKHQYSEQDIIVPDGFNEPWEYETDFDKAQAKAERKAEQADEVENLINDIINETPAREMARRYGRDYMKNAKAYRTYAAEVLLEETDDLERALKISRYENRMVDRAVSEATTHVLECVATRISMAYEKNCEPTLTDLLNALGMEGKV